MPNCQNLTQHPRQCVCSHNITQKHERLPQCAPTALCAKDWSQPGALPTWSSLAQQYTAVGNQQQREASSTFLIIYSFQPQHVRYWYRSDPFRSYLNAMRLISRVVLSLRHVNTRMPIHLLMSGERHAGFERQLVERLGVGVLSTSVSFSVPKWANAFHRGSFAKLAALSLTQFSRVVVLDSDTVVFQNIDFLMAVPAPAFVYRFKCYNTKSKIWEMNSGTMVLDPDEALHRRMTYIMNETGARIDDGHGGNLSLKNLAIGSDLGDQSVWRSFFTSVHELPAAFNTFKRTKFGNNESDWADVAVVHDPDVHRKWRIPHKPVERVYQNVTQRAQRLVGEMARELGLKDRGR